MCQRDLVTMKKRTKATIEYVLFVIFVTTLGFFLLFRLDQLDNPSSYQQSLVLLFFFDISLLIIGPIALYFLFKIFFKLKSVIQRKSWEKALHESRNKNT